MKLMILNYITGDIFKYFTIDDFYEYLNILSKSGIIKRILYLIEKHDELKGIGFEYEDYDVIEIEI